MRPYEARMLPFLLRKVLLCIQKNPNKINTLRLEVTAKDPNWRGSYFRALIKKRNKLKKLNMEVTSIALAQSINSISNNPFIPA